MTFRQKNERPLSPAGAGSSIGGLRSGIEKPHLPMEGFGICFASMITINLYEEQIDGD